MNQARTARMAALNADQSEALGRAFYDDCRFEGALKHFSNAIAFGKDTIHVHDCRVAALCRITGREQQALEAARLYILKFKNDKDAWLTYVRAADVYLVQNNYTMAHRALAYAERTAKRSKLGEEARNRALAVIQHRLTVARREHGAAQKALEATMTEDEKREKEEKEKRIRRVKMRRETGVNNRMLPHDVIVILCGHAVKENPNAAVVFGSVCKHWRNAVLNSPSLWSHLVVGSHRRKAKADLWIERSGNRLLSVTLQEKLQVSDPDDETFVSLRPLIPNVRHFYDYSLTWPREVWSQQFRSAETLVFECGRGLFDLGPVGGPRQGSLSEFIDQGVLSPDCTSLRRLDLSNFHFDDLPFEPPNLTGRFRDPQQVSNLRSLRVSKAAGKILPILRHAPYLEDLTLLRHITDEMVYDAPRIVLKHLCRFQEEDKRILNRSILEYLETPNLKELSLFKVDGAMTILRLPGLSQALPLITSLDLGHAVVRDKPVTSILRRMPSLQFLNVAFTSITDQLIVAMTPNNELDEEDQLLPNLVALSLAGTEVTAGAVRDFVNSRLPDDERIPVYTETPKTVAKSANAFRPSAPASSRGGRSAKASSSAKAPVSAKTPGSVTPLVPASTSAVASKHTTSSTRDPHRVRPRIQWLCLDRCESLDNKVLSMLCKKVTFVGCLMSNPVEDRFRGRGSYKWETPAEIEHCSSGCKVQKTSSGEWSVVHQCRPSLGQPVSVMPVKAEKGWQRIRRPAPEDISAETDKGSERVRRSTSGGEPAETEASKKTRRLPPEGPA